MKKDDKVDFSIEEDKPVDWFEPLYARANSLGEGVPWANMDTHPCFRRWLEKNTLNGKDQNALVIGCGMGDDAIALEGLGFQVTAFDVSESAIAFCKNRFPQTTVNFIQADLLKPSHQWLAHYDFVLEIYTIQALPPKYEAALIRNISRFVAPGGQILVIAEVSQRKRTFESGPPWLLTPSHIETFESNGLEVTGTTIEPDTANHDGASTYITTFTPSGAC